MGICITCAYDLVRWRRYCYHFVNMCICGYVRGCVCQHDKTKTHDRNDLKLNWHDSSPAILYPILPQRHDNTLVRAIFHSGSSCWLDSTAEIRCGTQEGCNMSNTRRARLLTSTESWWLRKRRWNWLVVRQSISRWRHGDNYCGRVAVTAQKTIINDGRMAATYFTPVDSQTYL